jgi:hypothetical protein
MDTLAPDTNALHLLGLTAFAQANPDRALLVILPSAVAIQPAASALLPAEEPDLLAQTLLYGEEARDAAGELRLHVRVQSDLQLRTLSFHGSTPAEGLRIHAVFCGDAPVFTHNEGVPVTRFEHPTLAGVVDGWQARAGTELTIVASAEGPARLVASVIGLKRVLR